MTDETQKKESVAPPVVAYRTLRNFFRGLAAAMPSRIDKSVMTSMSGSTQIQLLQALRRLGCIEPNGTPTARLRKLVKAEGPEFQAAMHEALIDTYPFLKDNDLSGVTTQQLQELFGTMGSGDTVRKAITFFIPAAKDAGIKLSPFLKEPGKRAPSNGKARRSRPAKVDEGRVDDPPPPPPAAAKSMDQMLMEKFPAFDPAWSDDIKQKWFTGFADLMARTKGKAE